MRNLPRSAQLYLCLIYLLGSVAALFAIITPVPKMDAEWWELGIYLVLSGIAGSKKIRLMRRHNAEDHVSMSLAYVLTCTAMLRFGPAAAVLIATVGSLSNGLFPKRQPNHQLLFNVALTMIEAWTAGLIFLWMNHESLPSVLPARIPPWPAPVSPIS